MPRGGERVRVDEALSKLASLNFDVAVLDVDVAGPGSTRWPMSWLIAACRSSSPPATDADRCLPRTVSASC